MTQKISAHPKVVSQNEWLKARKEFLAEEKAFTHQRDALNAKRRRLPMVKVDKDYRFDGPLIDGKNKIALKDLFEGRDQLIIYHFMLAPGAAEGCDGCSHIADNIPHLSHIHARNTTLVMVSRAPLKEIATFNKRMGWSTPWYSSFGSDFNYDFHVSVDEEKGSTDWNYEKTSYKGELPGLSVFLKIGDEVYHTYSTYARGLDILLNTYNFLDLTPFGRQEEWEDSPKDWPKTSTNWLRHHDKYDEEVARHSCHSSRDVA